MHYFAPAADTTHHGTIFTPIVHSVPLGFALCLFWLFFAGIEEAIVHSNKHDDRSSAIERPNQQFATVGKTQKAIRDGL